MRPQHGEASHKLTEANSELTEVRREFDVDQSPRYLAEPAVKRDVAMNAIKCYVFLGLVGFCVSGAQRFQVCCVKSHYEFDDQYGGQVRNPAKTSLRSGKK